MVQNMNLSKNDLLLYAVTDRSWLKNETLFQQVQKALDGGVTCLQLREKELSDDAFLTEALEISKLCKQYHVPFIINDNVDIAIKCNADGIHVGQSDMLASDVRKKIGDSMILGVSAQTVKQAVLAEKMGADYLGVGAVFSTSTKLDADNVPLDTLKEIVKSVSIPVVAIGGICEENILKLKGSGICGAAVVSAVFASHDITSASKRLLKLCREVTSNED